MYKFQGLLSLSFFACFSQLFCVDLPILYLKDKHIACDLYTDQILQSANRSPNNRTHLGRE